MCNSGDSKYSCTYRGSGDEEYAAGKATGLSLHRGLTEVGEEPLEFLGIGLLLGAESSHGPLSVGRTMVGGSGSGVFLGRRKTCCEQREATY